MKCFTHSQVDAVGSCKYCSKGMCVQCAKDLGIGIVCSEPCEAEIRTLHSMVRRNRKMYAFAPKSHLRNAIFCLMLAAPFIGFGLVSKSRFLSLYLTVSGVVMLCGAAFSFYNSRKIAKMASSE